MPWHLILSPFWIIPLCGWVLLFVEGSMNRDLILFTGAANMTVAPLTSIALLFAFLPAYQEAKRRAKRDEKIAKQNESSKTEPEIAANEND